MRGTTAIALVKNILKQVYCPMKRRSSGIMATSAPNKQSNDDVEEGEGPMTDDKAEAEPIVAFNSPPLPPVLGPVVVLSLLEMGSRSNDD